MLQSRAVMIGFGRVVVSIVAATLILGVAPQSVLAQPSSAASGAPVPAQRIDAVLIHPPVVSKMKCSEHPLGQEGHPGDALAQDCSVVRNMGGPEGNFPSFYSGNGLRNEDWYSWNEPLLAPFEGVVKAVSENNVTNQPGRRGAGMASVILFERIGAGDETPVQIGYVHVQDVRVELGDTVAAGEMVARIGNNGIADFPHVHIGAVRGDIEAVMRGVGSPDTLEALQVRFDLAAMGRIQGYGP